MSRAKVMLAKSTPAGVAEHDGAQQFALRIVCLGMCRRRWSLSFAAEHTIRRAILKICSCFRAISFAFCAVSSVHPARWRTP